jgi:predicted transport protein
MPLFQLSDRGQELLLVRTKPFALEKDLQKLIERNLGEVFNCRFVATEFSTGAEHAGRIDTLALSEESNPVIIEYKKVESSDLVNQSLFYLSWLQDHRGDFQVAVNRVLGADVEVDWSDIRVICIAPGYKKYDLHAVKMMGANIELWQYRFYTNGALYLEEIFKRTTAAVAATDNGKNPVMVAAGKKAALTAATATYTIEEHLGQLNEDIKSLADDLRQYILSLDDSIEEVPKKFYIAYKLTQNFVCMEVQKKKVLLHLKLVPDDVQEMPKNARDMREVGHFGTGDFEVTVNTPEQLEEARELIRMSFEKVGG